MRLATKIYMLCGAALVGGGVASLFLMLALKDTGAEFSYVLQHQVRQADAARLMQVTFKKQVQAWKDVLLRGHDPENLRKYSEEFHTTGRKVQEMGSSLKAGLNDESVRGVVDEFLSSHIALGNKYEAALQTFVEAKGLNPHEVDALVKGRDRATTDLCDRIVALLGESTAKADNAAEQRLRKSILTMSGVLLLAFVAVGIASTFIIRNMSAILRRAVSELDTGAEQVATAAAQVSASAEALAKGASEQAAALEETSATSEQINAMAQRNTENSRNAANLVAGSQQTIADTNTRLDQTMSAMREINGQSDKISKIIKTIDEIAFQTNLLALNAAVEAARAGEAGMGFAVVADEVRNLAQRCAQAAKDTAALIEESIVKASHGTTRVNEVAAAIRAITDQSSKLKTLVDEVNTGSHEQTRGIEQVAGALTQMEQVTQRAAANAEESAAAAEELTTQSRSLTEIVGRLSAMIDGSQYARTRVAA